MICSQSGSEAMHHANAATWSLTANVDMDALALLANDPVDASCVTVL